MNALAVADQTALLEAKTKIILALEKLYTIRRRYWECRAELI